MMCQQQTLTRSKTARTLTHLQLVDVQQEEVTLAQLAAALVVLRCRNDSIPSYNITQHSVRVVHLFHLCQEAVIEVTLG